MKPSKYVKVYVGDRFLMGMENPLIGEGEYVPCQSSLCFQVTKPTKVVIAFTNEEPTKKEMNGKAKASH